MAWIQVKVEDQRKNFIEASFATEKNFSDLCRDYNISRKTGYKWIERYHEEGLKGLLNKSTAPHVRPTAIDEFIIKQIIDVRIKFSKMGPKKIYAWLVTNKPGIEWPTPSSIGNILNRYGFTVQRKLRRRVAANVPSIRFGENINDVWSLDFKGTMFGTDGSKSDPFTLTDNVSRFLLKCQILKSNNGKCVWGILESAFREFGLPNRILSDNGPPFASSGVGRFSRVSINLIKIGIEPTWINPGKPQQNGRHERMHGTLAQEIAEVSSQVDLGIKLEKFQNYFNFERPHEALGQKTPGSVYVPSNRAWDGVLRSPEYPSEYIIRKVQKDGTINLNGERVFISETLSREPIGIIDEDSLKVYYGSILLGSINDEYKLEFPRIKTRKKL